MSILLSDIDATCASLGHYDGSKYFIENDTLQSLKHLIWILKRDNLDSHECRRYMGHKKILQTDLMPMFTHYCNRDGELSDVLLRLIVNLTSPPMLFFRQDLPKINTSRQIYMDLVDISYSFKEAFANSLEIWKALAIRFKKMIDIDISIRTEEQNIVIERLLILTRNVLQVPENPLYEKRVDNDFNIHDGILCALHESGMFELILYILASHYENQFYLHALEVIYLIFRDQNAETLAFSVQEQRSAAEKYVDEQALIAARRNEKAKSMRNLPPARHSRFGGTYVYRNMKSVSDKDLICHQPLEKVVNNDLNRDKKKTKPNFRLIKDEDRYERQSAYTVRHFLREFCIEILSSAFNNLVGQSRRLVERNHANDGAIGYDQSYLLWAIRFFLQFNRHKGFNMDHVSSAMSKETIHWITLQIQHDSEMILAEKKKKLVWNRRLQLGVSAYSEFLLNLSAMDDDENEDVKMLSSDLKCKIFNTSEYSDIILNLLLTYNENTITRMCLRKLIEAVNIFLNTMEKFNIQDYEIIPAKKKPKNNEENEKTTKKISKKSRIDELQEKWNNNILPKVSEILSNCEITENDWTTLNGDPDESEDDQKKAQMQNIVEYLNDEEYKKALLLLYACRNTWACEEFGTEENCLIDEIIILKELYLSISNNDVEEGDENDFWAEFDKSDEEVSNENDGNCEEELEDVDAERESLRNFKSFSDTEKRLVNQKLVRACVFVLQSWENMSYTEIKSAVIILHRIAVNQKFPIMLMQSQLFRIFQQVFDSPFDKRYEELRRIGKFIVRKFIDLSKKNSKMFAEILFYKSHRECYDIENHYEDHHRETEGKNKVWLEHEEEELQRLFMLNQESPQTDQDVIDWIVENLSDKSRTRRGVIKKLKDLGLIFKAPTKKSTVASHNRNLFIRNEDEKLKDLYEEYRLDDDCLAKIMQVFHKKRTQKAVINRMVQLGLIADESELMPKKPIKNKKNFDEFSSFEEHEKEGEEEKTDSESDNQKEKEINVRNIKKRIVKKKFSDEEEEEQDLLSNPTENEHDIDEKEEIVTETVSKKRQLLRSDSEDDSETNTSNESFQKKKVRRIIDDESEEDDG